MDQAQNAQTPEQVAAADRQYKTAQSTLKWTFILSLVPIVFMISYSLLAMTLFIIGLYRYNHGQAGAEFMVLVAIVFQLIAMEKVLLIKLREKK